MPKLTKSQKNKKRRVSEYLNWLLLKKDFLTGLYGIRHYNTQLMQCWLDLEELKNA